MAVFFVKKRGWWRYEFEVNKTQYTKSGFKTKREAQKALLEHKENSNFSISTGKSVKYGVVLDDITGT